MKFEASDLFRAQKEGIISSEQVENLVKFLSTVPVKNETPKKKFTIENFLYYFGAILIIQAMGWYLGNVWEAFKEGGILVLTICYMLIFTVVGNILWKKDKKTPGGLLYVCAVSIVPLMVWAIERLLGLFPDSLGEYSGFHVWVRSCWILMEIATIVVGLVYLKYRKVPFLTLPICWALWYLSMDVVPLCMANFGEPTWSQRNWTSLVFAILMLGFALKHDKKTVEDFSGWLYLFGATMFWGAIISIFAEYKLFDNEFLFFLFALAAFGYMILSILLQRKIFMVWGALSIISYIGHLAYKLFEDSIFFPLAIVLLGLGIIFGATYYAKNCDRIEQKLRKLIMG